MNRFADLLFMLAVASPLYLLLGWGHAFEWPLITGVTLTFDLAPVPSFFMILLAIGAPTVAITMVGRNADRYGQILYVLLVVAMQLLFMARDLVGLFIGWEIMTWTGYLLLMRSPRSDLETTQSYILFSLASAFALLGGMLAYYHLTGSFDIEPLSSTQARQPAAFAFLILFTLAALIKIGNVPVHRWLPMSYDQAPDTLSPMMSALMSKVGVYALVLMLTVFPDGLAGLLGRVLDGPAAGYVLAWAGVLTSLIATFKAIAQDDVKRLLAYSSIAQVGYITTAIGVGSALAVTGALFHAFVHTLVKLLLFISFAGIILRTGQRRFQDLGDLIYRMPVSFFGVLIGIIGLAGMPPLPGFVSKYLIFVALLDARWLLLLAAMVLSSTAAFIYCYKLIYAPFLGHASSDGARSAREAPWQYWIPQVIIMGLLFAVAFVPGITIEWLIDPIIVMLGLTPLEHPSWAEVATPYGGYNGTLVLMVFGIAFVLVTAIFFVLRGRLRRAGSRYDLSFAGEVPDETMPLHYGAGMGRELRRIPAVAWVLEHSTSGLYRRLTDQMRAAANILNALYTGQPQAWVTTAVSVLAVLLTVQFVSGVF